MIWMCTYMYIWKRVSCPMENPTNFPLFMCFIVPFFLCCFVFIFVGCSCWVLAFCFVESTNIENKLKWNESFVFFFLLLFHFLQRTGYLRARKASVRVRKKSLGRQVKINRTWVSFSFCCFRLLCSCLCW